MAVASTASRTGGRTIDSDKLWTVLHENFVFSIRNSIGFEVFEIAFYQKNSIRKDKSDVGFVFNVNIDNSFSEQLNNASRLQWKLTCLLYKLASRVKTVPTLDVHPS